MILGLTGGIACGKSTVLNRLRTLTSWRSVDADVIVRELLEKDTEVRKAICSQIDPRAYDSAGEPDRKFLREFIFSNDTQKSTLESILHPKVRDAWLASVQESRGTGDSLIVDIPLLFETEAEGEFDAVVSVLCSGEIQMARLQEKRGLSLEIAKKMIASQLPARVKSERSAFVIWNDGSLNALISQTDHLARLLSNPVYG